MKVEINGNIYKQPGNQNNFQQKLFIHLINWKWKHITKEAGVFKKTFNGVTREFEFDAILPISVQKDFPLIYPAILTDLLQLQKQFYFKLHDHFFHMASSQAANINLFLPLLLHPKANDIFKQIKPDFVSIAKDQLYKGFRIEFWDGNSNEEKGLLGDHNAIAGTDSDMAIAYYNENGELCLWLIEHKLTESEFTECGGFKSKGRKEKHDCSKSFSEILKAKENCYYHDVKKYEYWNLTDINQSLFVNNKNSSSCPFKGGLNQLWRNQLFGLALENEGMYKNVYFSVIKHQDNTSLDKSISEYKILIDNNPKFSHFDSKKVVDIVKSFEDNDLKEWVNWYCDLYDVR